MLNLDRYEEYLFDKLLITEGSFLGIFWDLISKVIF